MLTTTFLFLSLFTSVACQADGANMAAKDLRSKDTHVRLAAIPTLLEDGSVKSGKALQKALKDDDWGVQIAVAEALSGWVTLDPTDSLVALALDTPIAQVRIAAAQALAQRDTQQVMATLAGALAKKKDSLAACLTLVQLPAGEFDEQLLKGLSKLVKKHKEPRVRAAAASALHLLSLPRRLELLQVALADENLLVRIAAVNGVRHFPFASASVPLRKFLFQSEVDDVFARRLSAAIVSILTTELAADSPAATELADNLFAQRPQSDLIAWRIATIARLILEIKDAAAKDIQSKVRQDFLSLVEDSGASEASRATAAWALGADTEGGETTIKTLYTALAADSSARVRRAAMVALLELEPMETTLVAALLERIEKDSDPSIRRLAVVELGVPELQGVAATLIALCADLDWQVATCAIVSLGKTRDATALDALVEVSKSSDWRFRGAAVVGLSHLYQKAAIGAVIGMLADPEPVVARTAHEYLQIVTYQKMPREVEAYREWWSKNEGVFLVLTPEKARERGRAYADFGGSSISAPYKDMDVFVFESRGDHIQDLMARRDIEYSLTGTGKVASAEVHPFGVYVANCVGDCLQSDIDYLQWYVLTGGYLFSSCWALNGTVEHIERGVIQSVRRYIGGDLVDRVIAEPTVAASPYLEGIFELGSQPIYSLEGAHLIDVLLPERCEVLLDSPECSSRWGSGNLAAWFDVGHGLMLDSANHFGMQGFAGAESLKKPVDRQAYAVNHMGLSLEDLREVRTEKWWKSNQKAEEFIWDESAFRFLTNFVRWKRAGGR